MTAQTFATKYVQQLAMKILEWKNTAVLRDGKLRELADICRIYANGTNALVLAESIAITAILEVVSQPKGNNDC